MADVRMGDAMLNMKRLLTLCLHVFVCGVSLVCVSPAFADNCERLDKNKTWVAEFDLLKADFQNEAWESALRHAEKLEKICEKSPILNYSIAHIYQGLGDEEKYLFYLQKSTQNTEQFSVKKDMLDKMWSEKYIATHPEAAPENIKAMNEKLKELTAELEHQKQLSNDNYKGQIGDYKTPMWIGAGVGIGGLVMGGVGAALLFTTSPITFKRETPRYTENPSHVLGWALTGVGTALTVTGAILAGIYGYKYTRAKNDLTLSLTLTPANSSFTIQF